MTTSKKRCCGCGKYGKTEDMKRFGTSYFCSFEHATAHANKPETIKKGKEIAAKNERAELRKRKEALRPYRWYESKAQALFNKFIRLRDRDDDCISCDKSLDEIEKKDGWKPGGCWDAGHYKTRGAHPELRFTEDNCHKQCKSCNGGSGRFSAKARTVGERYREKLIDKIGIDRVEALEVDVVKKKFTIDELKEIIEIYKAKCKELQDLID